MANPVRIYVLHHPASTAARALAERIFDWFRLPSLDGIPVYVRSEPAPRNDRWPNLPLGWQKDWPLPPFGLLTPRHPPRRVPPVPVLEYLLPLVDAEMVRDPKWHDFLSALVPYCANAPGAPRASAQGILFPVALHASAFNLPRAIAGRNFIRHEAGAAPADATEETLQHLTEALARDLDRRLTERPTDAADRFKVFISYARADGTDIAKALRDYIQGQTQCLAFLDENDIGYGQPFDAVLQANVGAPVPSAARRPSPPPAARLARAMIVVNTDEYADRTWCRWEIDRFTTPRPVPLAGPSRAGDARCLHLFDPVLVVDAVQGRRMTRVLPELARAPMVRWDARRARLCFSVLMREVVLGLRDVHVARQVFAEDQTTRNAIFVNRLPGPMAIERLLRPPGRSSPAPRKPLLRYPGNGLALIELRLLRQAFPDVTFRAFRDVLPPRHASANDPSGALGRMRALLDQIERGKLTQLPLREKVLALSTSYSERDLAAVGTLSRHQDETLLHLLRPLLRLGADLSYGGLPPKDGERQSATRNITFALLRLCAEERPETDAHPPSRRAAAPPPAPPRGPLLFNVCAWPRFRDITAEDEAAWINSYRVLRCGPEMAGLPPFPHPLPQREETPPPDYQRYVACVTSAIRRRFQEGCDFHIPWEGPKNIVPAAFIFLGGRMDGFSGIMPGILEEFLHAAATQRPIYLFGGLGGAAGVLARALRGQEACPPELTKAYYAQLPLTRKHEYYAALLGELQPGDPDPDQAFARLWEMVQEYRAGGLPSLRDNGLTPEQNRHLMTTEDTFKAVELAWQGLSGKFLLPEV